MSAPARIAGSLRRTARAVAFTMRHTRNRVDVLRALIHSSDQATVELRDGTSITAPELRTLIPLLTEVFVNREYEHGDVRVEPNDVVVDIGAHVGVFALYAASHGAARIIAYEPSPVNATLFAHNMKRNSIANVQLVHAAVGDRLGSTTLGLQKWSVGNIVFDNIGLEPSENTVDVSMITLAEIFVNHNLERINFLKMDCEGSEGAVLTAATEALQRVDRIAMEYHDNWSRLEHDAIARLLTKAGFMVDVVPSRTPFIGMIYAKHASLTGGSR
ncbi:MAG: FkbM family methyltransferase [bacterium]|nr:FkbM family methyltransferase [Candidatus Kapabacteria bacterium]